VDVFKGGEARIPSVGEERMSSGAMMRLPHADLPSDPEEIFARILDPKRKHEDLPRLYDQLRTVAPVWQSSHERLGRPWVVTRHADATELLRTSALMKDERLLAILSASDEKSPFVRVMARMFAFLPPGPHERMRSLVNRGFTPRSIEKLRPQIQALVDELIDDLESRGEMDLVSEFAFRVPVTVICQMLGAPVEDVPRIEDWAAIFARRADESEGLSPEMEKRADEIAVRFVDYVKELIAVRRGAPREDLLSRLLAVQETEPDLTDDDIAATTILLFQAGHDTTANLIAKSALALIRHPEQAEWLRRHPEAIEHATEELLRYDTSVQLTTKFADRDISFHGRVIRRDDPVMLIWGGINRDPDHFADPHRLDFTRENVDHYSFGMGRNYCLGARLARLEIQHAVGTLVRRLPGLRLVEEELEYKPQLHLHGLARLPVAW
jgi:cytochrome P450